MMMIDHEEQQYILHITTHPYSLPLSPLLSSRLSIIPNNYHVPSSTRPWHSGTAADRRELQQSVADHRIGSRRVAASADGSSSL